MLFFGDLGWALRILSTVCQGKEFLQYVLTLALPDAPARTDKSNIPILHGNQSNYFQFSFSSSCRSSRRIAVTPRSSVPSTRDVLVVMCDAPPELPVHLFVRLTVSFSFSPIRHVLTLLPHIIHAITHRVMILDAHLAFTVDTSMITHKMTRSVCYFSESPPPHFC